jgi:hypothetical protein
VRDHVFDGLTRRSEVFAGIEIFGMLDHMLTDSGGHRHTDVGVDVYLAYGRLGGRTKHLLGYTDSVGHFAAVGVYFVFKLRRNGRSAVKHYRETGQTAFDFFEDIETELRLLAGLEFIRAVAGADGYCERIDAGLVDEFLDLFRAGVCGVLSLYVDGVLDTGKTAELASTTTP